MHDDDEWFDIQTYGNNIDATIAQGLLESEGIEVMVENMGASSVLPNTLSPKLKVRVKDVDRAKEILARTQ